jgi:hypothetical protein
VAVIIPFIIFRWLNLPAEIELIEEVAPAVDKRGVLRDNRRRLVPDKSNPARILFLDGNPSIDMLEVHRFILAELIAESDTQIVIPMKGDPDRSIFPREIIARDDMLQSILGIASEKTEKSQTMNSDS